MARRGGPSEQEASRRGSPKRSLHRSFSITPAWLTGIGTRRGETASIGGFEFRVLRADRRRVDTLRVVAPRDVLPPEERPTGGIS